MDPIAAERAQNLPAPALEDPAAGDRPTERQRHRFVALLERLAPVAGRSATPWPGLRCYRAPRPTSPDPTIYTPSLCIVAQGVKEAALGDRVVRYDPLHYLVIGAHLPVRATVLEASPERPFLSLVLDVEASAVRDLLLEMAEVAPGDRPRDAAPPLKVSALDGRLLDAVLRFLGAVEDPLERRILAPAALREIVYLALRGEQGDLLRAAVRGDGRSLGIERALRFIHRHHAERLDVPTLAREVGMSPSTLHHRFKAATSLTPIQYLKRMRLHRARQLMVDEGCHAAEAAFRVGYESPSQFSRDFKRHFGSPPRRYVESWDLTPSVPKARDEAPRPPGVGAGLTG
jgi:AraC-like DNA-binding protein